MIEALVIFGCGILALLFCVYLIWHYETWFSREVDEFIREDIRKCKEEENNKNKK